MLISRRDDRLVHIRQVDHAAVAGELAAHWGGDFQAPPRADSARLAAAMHDEGWREPDEAPLFNDEQQRPLHFLEIPMTEHIPLYGRGVEQTYARDPYAGLLVSMHWTGLYRGRWGMQAGRLQWQEAGRSEVERLQDEAVDAEERRWIEVKRGLDGDVRRSELEAGLWHTYDLLQGWDLLSLYVCMIPSEPAAGEARTVASTLKSLDQEPGTRMIEGLPTSVGGERVDVTLTPLEAGVVALDPYPFDIPALELSVTGRAIPDRTYDGREDARAALDAAEEVTVACRMISA